MTTLTADTLQAIRRAGELIANSKRAVALSGAGISTPSGVPDFRSIGSGLWRRFLPMEVASLSAFRYEPENFFAWLRPLASHMMGALPNAAHFALAQMEQAGYIKTLITQNIDTLHHRAGSRNVLEIHGTFDTLTCTGCFHQFHSTGIIEPYLETGTIPHCPECGQILKPDVILFEEQLPVRVWMKAEQACKTCDVLIVMGTSLEVLPSAKLPMRAVEAGAHLIMVNKTSTYIDVRAEVLLNGDVAEIIPLIAEEVLGD